MNTNDYRPTNTTPNIRKTYHGPRLRVFGELRDLTLAPSPFGLNEPGSANSRSRIWPPTDSTEQ